MGERARGKESSQQRKQASPGKWSGVRTRKLKNKRIKDGRARRLVLSKEKFPRSWCWRGGARLQWADKAPEVTPWKHQ